MDDVTDEVPMLFAEAVGWPGDGFVPSPVKRRREGWRVLRILGLALGGLLLAALLNADHLVDRADKKPFGDKRDFWLAAWQPFEDASEALYLNRPRQWLDTALDRELRTPGPAVPPIPAPQVVATVTVVPEERAPDPGQPVSAALPAVSAPPAPEPVPAASPPAPTPRLRVPTADTPLKLWVGGDSMAVAFGASLGRLASATGLVLPTSDARSSSGLTRPDFYDWPAHMAEVAAKDAPDVMVLMFGANDSQGIRTPEGKAFQPLSDGWRAEYRRRVAGTMELLVAPGRLVIWVGQPVMESDGFSARMADIDAIYREEAALREGVLYFESWPLLVDGNGKYAAFLPDSDGATQGMRAGMASTSPARAPTAWRMPSSAA